MKKTNMVSAHLKVHFLVGEIKTTYFMFINYVSVVKEICSDKTS